MEKVWKFCILRVTSVSDISFLHRLAFVQFDARRSGEQFFLFFKDLCIGRVLATPNSPIAFVVFAAI